MKQPILQELFQNASKQVLNPDPQPSTSGTFASAVLLSSPDVSYDISSNG
jgi:hypothetical protein